MNAEPRQFVEKMYTGPGWKRKVAKMSDAQVFAIYQKEQQKLQTKALVDKEAKKTKQENDDIPF